MQVGLSTASFYPRVYNEEAVDLIGQMGIRDCEIFLSTYREYAEEFGEELSRRVQHWGIRVHGIHTLSTQFEPQLFARVDRQREDALDIFRRVLRVAHRLGARNYVLHGPANLKRADVLHHDYALFGECAETLACEAARFGMDVAWENVYWCHFFHPDFIRHILEKCDHPNLKFTLDIKQAMRAGLDPMAFVPAMGRRLGHVHLCDYLPDGRLTLPGRGCFDFSALKEALDGIGYDGALLVEVYSGDYRDYGELAQSVEMMRKIFCPGV